ncbi:hypothetical protein ACE1AT_13860 [Pelatocladus sp. BLCC-F211]|uniref:hypothetical protein n=1 Tax=Pelatocladus sp. BLCC-F211 TaxID=3342752 RepID=UPI0035B9FCEA
MNESELFQIHRSRFKSWIKKRFIAETDVYSMPSEIGLAWAAALIELASEIQITALSQAPHQIVPFRRGR